MIPWTKRMTWMHSLMVLRDPAGMERLVSYYEVIRKLGDPERAGLAVSNDDKREFDPLVEFPRVPKFSIDGNASVVRAGGRDYFYFKGLWPGGAVRVPAEWKAVQELGAYEIFEAEGGSGVWKRGATPVKPSAPAHFTDVQTGETISVQCDAIAWNEYRKRWIVLLQVNPGEVWYAEADSPTGPMGYAARVAEHGKYTFYWPVPHPFFEPGRRTHGLLRRHLHRLIFRQPRDHAALQLQPDHVPHGARRHAPVPTGARLPPAGRPLADV